MTWIPTVNREFPPIIDSIPSIKVARTGPNLTPEAR